MCDAVTTELPVWARVSEKRRAHIARVTTLLAHWSQRLALDADEARCWRDAGLWHDALRDAPEHELRELAAEPSLPVPLLHGPAAASRLVCDGERRRDLLEAVRWHTLGSPDWERTGRALFMADYLEPGRAFARSERAYFAAQVPHDFEGTFREVVRHRLAWTVHEGNELHPETVALWNRVR